MPYPLLPLRTALLLAVSGCASTVTSQLIPSPQAPVCQGSSKAMIIWATQWRPDQKDIPAREAAASDGIGQFFQSSGCFSSASVRRLPQYSTPSIEAAVADAGTLYDKIVLVVVRELGPTVKIGASLALVEGGTEVVLEVSEYMPASAARRTFAVQWRNGGPGVIKGVDTLPLDMQSALVSGLQPAAR
jgi:hypothetical protein